MRKLVVISVVVFAIVVACGYCISWYVQAAQAKRMVEQAIAKINTSQKYITYDSIETSGFPSELDLAIVRPHFTGRIDEILKNLTEQAHLPPRQNPEWDEDLLLDGRLVVGVNVSSSHFTVRLNGNWQNTATIGGQKIATSTQSNGDAICVEEFARTGGLFSSMWSFMPAPDFPTFVKSFRSINCVNPGGSVDDAGTHEKLMTSGPANIFISYAPHGDAQDIRLYVNGAQSEVTPAGDKVITAYVQAFSPTNTHPPMLSAYGKQSLDLDFTYSGPMDLKNSNHNPDISIQLSKFDITNQLYTSSNTFYLSNDTTLNKRKARVALKMMMNCNEKYDAMLPDILRGMIQQLYTDPDPRFAGMRETLKKYTPDQVYDIVSPAVPNFHSLGKMVHAVDVSYEGTPDFKAGDINLGDLEFSATPYGIVASGTGQVVQGQPLPQAHVTLLCTNCLKMIDDMAAYAGRLQKVLSVFDPQPPTFALFIKPQVVDAFKTFLKHLANSTTNDFSYELISNPTAGVTVNSKPLNQVTYMFSEDVGNVLRQATQQMPATAPAQAPGSMQSPAAPATMGSPAAPAAPAAPAQMAPAAH